MLFWTLIFLVIVLACAAAWFAWRRGYTIVELIREPPQEVDLPEIVTILSYLHHELIKHRLPLVSTVAGQTPGDIDEGDVEMLKQAVTGDVTGRPSLVGELEGYLGGLRRAAGRVHLNFRRDAMVRRARRACETIQSVADGLGARRTLTAREHRRLQNARTTLHDWFRPRLQAIRNSVLSLELTRELFEDPVERVRQELGLNELDVSLPALDRPIQVRMLRPDFNLVLRNLVRNAIQRSIKVTGEARLAIEVDQRLELTGEESVLIRVYDTDDKMLSRQELYGGVIGRGLNLATTTLRRYDGALGSVKSRREGFAKALEIRLFKAHAQESDAALLRRPDPFNQVVPASLGATLLAGALMWGAGASGALPDPLEDLFAPDIALQRQDALSLAEERAEALEASAKTRSLAVLEAILADPKVRKQRVPGPDAITFDSQRCRPQRIKTERKVEVDCALIDARHKLHAPLLLFDIQPPFDVSNLSAEASDLVQKGSDSQKLPPKSSCLSISLLEPGQAIPETLAQQLPNSVARKAKTSRVLVDYHRCLKLPRYPIRSEITLKVGGNADDLPKHEALSPTKLDLRIELRRVEAAQEAYPKLSNELAILPERADRSDLTRAIARHVAQEFFYNQDAGLEVDQKALAMALYFGWVRPGLYDGVWERVARTRQRKGPDADYCDLYNQVREGYGFLQELDSRAVGAEIYRSQYYYYQARLWINGDLNSAMEELSGFQRTLSRQTDFVQGARLYLALLLALGPDPAPAAEPDPAVMGRVDQIVAMLSALQRDARRSARRTPESPYARVKLLGLKALGGDGDEGHQVADTLCAFGRAHSPWIALMSDEDYASLFGDCQGFPTRQSDEDTPTSPDLRRIPRDLDTPQADAGQPTPSDAGDPDPAPEDGADNANPDAVDGADAPTARDVPDLRQLPASDSVERATRYFESFRKIMSQNPPWQCE